jgi:hypothetical protein
MVGISISGHHTVTLPKHKHIAWSTEFYQMISMGKTSTKALELTIEQMENIGFIISWVYHFLSHLRTLLTQAWNRRFITIDKMCKNNLALIQLALNKTIEGINMNLLAFCTPDQIYYSDFCPANLGGYSDQSFAWRFQIQRIFSFRQ